MKKLRIGVIGLGVGRLHLGQYKAHPAVELAAAADLDEKRLTRAVAEFGVARGYASGEEMLEKEALDVVSVCTPNKLHKPLTIAALRRGCHVLCEKPMAINAAQACEMLEAARAADRRLMINFSYRFNDQSYALKRQVESGVLGEIYFGRSLWHRRRGLPGFGGWFGIKECSGGGALIDLGVHRLDLALWLMGYPKPAWVMGAAYDPIASELARREGKKFDVEDLAVAAIRFENGATLHLEASWASNTKSNERMETILLGTRGGLTQRNIGESYDFEAEIHLEAHGCPFDMKLHPPVPAARSAMAHFVDAILHDTPHTATGEEGYIVMRILDAIYESARSGAPVKVG